MKKNLLTLMFVIAFVCVGVSVASAKNSSSPRNSVAVSKKILVAKTKANSLKARCNVLIPCSGELTVLLLVNSLYESYCASGNYQVSCAPFLAGALIDAGNAYQGCMDVFISKNIDRKIDRKKTEKSRNATSSE